MTFRAVAQESKSGSLSGVAAVKERKRILLSIRVNQVAFDGDAPSLRVAGQCVRENEYVKMGQYHTIDIDLGHDFRLFKPCWDSIHCGIVSDCSDPVREASVAALMMQEGLANLCIVGKCMTMTKAKLQCSLPKKKGSDLYNKRRRAFFENMYAAVKKHVDFEKIKVLIVGSPGFLAEDFISFFVAEASSRGDTRLSRSKQSLLRVHSSSGRRTALEELLGSAAVASQVADIRAAEDSRALQRFYAKLSLGDVGGAREWVAYGYEHVKWADEERLVEELLVADSLFRAKDLATRKRYVSLVEGVRSNGGKVLVFSSSHATGAQLELYSGVVCVLRAPFCLDEEVERFRRQAAVAAPAAARLDEELRLRYEQELSVLDKFEGRADFA